MEESESFLFCARYSEFTVRPRGLIERGEEEPAGEKRGKNKRAFDSLRAWALTTFFSKRESRPALALAPSLSFFFRASGEKEGACVLSGVLRSLRRGCCLTMFKREREA